MELSRREALVAGGTLGVVGSAGCVNPISNVVGQSHDLSGDYHIEQFVTRDGRALELDGERYRYNGMMALLTHTNPDIQKSWINTAMQLATQYDVDAYRCWGFPAIWDDVSPPHTGPGEFDDTWLDLFDYTIAKAKETGVRLIVPLLQGVHVDAANDRQTYAPSPAAYGTWSDSVTYTDRPRAFIEDEQANDYFKEWIEYLLTRENQYTGVEYRNEPTILCWECANELEYKGDRRGDSLAFWYDDIASHVKSIDSNHLVSTGMHGSMGEIYEPWTERCAYVRDHQVELIDICSVHDYPIYGSNGELTIRSPELAREYVEHKIQLAHSEIGKPVYVGEYGCWFNPRATVGYVSRLESPESASDVQTNRDYPMAYPDQHDDGVLVTRKEEIDGAGLSDRNDYFENFTDAAEAGLDGSGFWRLSPGGSDSTEDRIESSPLSIYTTDEATLDVIRAYYEQIVA